MPRSDHLCLEFDEQSLDGSIPERFAQVVRRFPGRTALIHDSQRMTYRELDRASNQIANWLRDQEDLAGEPVGLLFSHGIPVIVAIVGVLKAGLAFSALEPFAPHERLSKQVEDLGCRLILTESSYLEHASPLTGEGTRAIDINDAASNYPTTDPRLAISPLSVAVISYTSGSTGAPKGVQKTHRYYVRRSQIEMWTHATTADDVLSLLTYTTYTSSLIDLFPSLLIGSALCIFDLKRSGAQNLKEWILRHRLTQIHLPNTALRILLGTLDEEEILPTVRCLRPSFRLYSKEIQALWKHLRPDAFIIHSLGSSETGRVTQLKLQRETVLTDNIVPVGYPLPGVEITLLDDARQPVPMGEVGEIWVRSPYLSPGYWRKPGLTNEKFIPDPQDSRKRICRLGDLGRFRSDGCLELVGRKDSQVKIRGYRVEMEEVEIALEGLEVVQQAVVVAESDDLGEKRMIAYVVPVDGTTGTAQGLRNSLRRLLPEYMIPFRFVLLEALPFLPNGKVDRQALVLPGAGRPDLDRPYVAARTPLEAEVTSIWADVLEIDQVGIHDPFLDLGGHSLQAMRIVSRVLEQFEVELSIQELFSKPTVAEMALAILAQLASTTNLKNLERMPHD